MEQVKYFVISVMGLWILGGCTNTSFHIDDSTSGTTGVVASATPTTTTSTTPTPTPTATPTVATCASTNAVSLSIVSVGTLSDYAEKYLYAPTTVNLVVNLANAGNNRYAGNVQISYYDQGAYHVGSFDAPTGTNVSIDSLDDNGVQTAEYNYWYGGGAYFTGFFQDSYGAIVLSVTGKDANNCLNGSVYYKNFTATAAPQSPYRKCWFIRSGPYDCRAENIVSKSSPVPDGYTLLGTFSGLPLTQAFH